MIFQMCSALGLVAAAMVLNMAFASVASAQDVMQLDLAFKNGQLPTLHGQASAADLRGRRQDVDAVEQSITATRHHPKRRRHQKT
jgi:hypothetical protein